MDVDGSDASLVPSRPSLLPSLPLASRRRFPEGSLRAGHRAHNRLAMIVLLNPCRPCEVNITCPHFIGGEPRSRAQLVKVTWLGREGTKLRICVSFVPKARAVLREIMQTSLSKRVFFFPSAGPVAAGLAVTRSPHEMGLALATCNFNTIETLTHRGLLPGCACFPELSNYDFCNMF